MKKAIVILVFLLIPYMAYGYATEPEIARSLTKDDLEVGDCIVVKITVTNPTNKTVGIYYSEKSPTNFDVISASVFEHVVGALVFSGEIKPYSSLGGDYTIKANSKGKYDLTGVCHYYYDNVSGVVNSTDTLIVIENPFKDGNNGVARNGFEKLWILFQVLPIHVIAIVVLSALFCFTILWNYIKKK